MATAIDKREAVMSLLDPAKAPTYIPAAFFLHFDPTAHSGQAAIDRHQEFFRFTGMDFVKIQLEVDLPQLSITSPDDWGKFPRLGADVFGAQLEVVRGLVSAMKPVAPVVLTLYSPFMIAAGIVGPEQLNRRLEEDLESVGPLMESVTEDLLTFVRACIKVGVDGFYHSTQGGESGRFSDAAVFEQGVKPYDLAVMEEANRQCPFNILHICDYHRRKFGGYDDLTMFLDYPGGIVNCSLENGMNSQLMAAMFRRPFMGGMDRTGLIATGSIGEVRTAAREALSDAPDRFILGADCTVPADTPWENLRAAIEEAHAWQSA